MQTSKTLVLAAAAAAFSLFSAGAIAQGVSTKIASVKTAGILQAPQFKAGQEKMKQEFEKRAKDLEAEIKKFQADAEKFSKERDLLAAADRAKQEKDLSTRQVDIGYKKGQLQEDIQKRDQQITAEIRTKLQTVINQIAKEKGIDIVVQDPLFASAAVDITDDVLKKLGAPAGK